MNWVIMSLLTFIFAVNTGFSQPRNHYHNYDINCVALMEDVYFGSYNPFEPQIKRSYGYLKVRCSGSGTANFTVKVIGGNSRNPVKRYLYSPSREEKLFYNLYYKSCVFGDGTGETCPITSSISCDGIGYSEKLFTIVGVIPPMQNVSAADDYQDVLTVIIEY